MWSEDPLDLLDLTRLRADRYGNERCVFAAHLIIPHRIICVRCDSPDIPPSDSECLPTFHRPLATMHNLTRALRDALAHWPSILLATLCSVGVAVVWGGNIGAFFPILEVTLRGEPLQAWVRQEIADAEHAIATAEKELEQLERELPVARTAEKRASERQILRLQDRIESEQAALARTTRLKSYVDRFLPVSAQQTVVLIVAVCFVASAIKHLLLLANTYLIARVSSTIARDIRRRVFSQAIFMDRRSFSGFGTSGFSAHITYSTEMLSNGVTEVFGGAVREPLKLIACLIGAGMICWRLLLISLVVVPLVVLMIVLLGKKVKRVCQRVIENATGLHHVMLEAFGSIQTVQAYGMEKVEQRRFAAATDTMREFALKTAFYNGLSRPITELLGVGMMGAALVAGSYLVLNQETEICGIQVCDRPLSAASLLVFFGMLVGATDPVRKMSGVITGINSGMVAADMIYPILDRESAIIEPSTPITVPRPHSSIAIRDVDFAYDGSNFVLRDVNLEIPFGTKIAIVGANGSGKSSLVNLLCRFYDVQRGAICIDGVDIRQMATRDLRSRIGLVTQQTELFNESILYNIKYGTPDCSDAQAHQAAKLAHAHEFIMACEAGYATRVGQNGQRLSGGQRQRIALARAFLREPEILILDEATSQIDVHSEQLIHDAIQSFSRDRTVIMITHRASTLELADVIIEFRDRRIVDRQAVGRAA